MGWRRKLKKIGKRILKAAPGALNFVPGGTMVMQASSALKSAGINMNRLRMAEKGKLISAIPLSEVATTQKTAALKPAARISVSATRAALDKRTPNKVLEGIKRESADRKRLEVAMKKLDPEEQKALYQEYKANTRGLTWPEYASSILLR